MFMAVIAVMMAFSVSAQFYIYCKNGQVIEVDSISIIAPNGNTPDIPTPDTPNELTGVFSVAADKQVKFSRGNLQYTQSTQTWSFASTQYEFLGTDNVIGGRVSTSSTMGDSKSGNQLSDKVDLFGWSSSTSSVPFGVDTSTDWRDYSGDFVDWGTNTIGTDAPNTWRTLSAYEWDYLLNTRINASNLKGIAHVNGINGLILLPDNWVCPSDITFKSGFHQSYGKDYYAAYQSFTADQWLKLEAAGAVLIPAAGNRNGTVVKDVHMHGGSWSSTVDDKYLACSLSISPTRADAAVVSGSNYTAPNRLVGRSVRLVKDVK